MDNKKTRIVWEGKGYYQRTRDYQGSSENGISWVGFVWRRCEYFERDSHLVQTQNEIWRTFELRYHRPA